MVEQQIINRLPSDNGDKGRFDWGGCAVVAMVVLGAVVWILDWIAAWLQGR